ncbi:hypothetical protein [Thermomonospora amylolytica]|uniref:hypothetical protein n=1 Tax=Thermomonospora amylolytica TaxID=1411117 RepID=UPI0013004765|nr:hypothetical protein [Thermomonospora amylolytica]
MKAKSLLALTGAVGGTLAAAGVVFVLLDGDPETADRAAPGVPGVTGETREIAEVLVDSGATGCRGDRGRVECRFSDRYVAAEVVDPRLGVTVDSMLPGWKTGAAQASTGDRGPFAVLYGRTWLVTGPEAFVEEVQERLQGRIVYCDRPYGACY